jgi:hypothetical protein
LLLVADWFPVAFAAVAFAAVAFAAVAFAAVAFAAVALVPVMFCCCAMAVSLPMTDENPDRSAAAANIPIIGIAPIALAALR